MWGEETDPVLLSTKPGDYRNPLASTLGVRPAETGVLSKGCVTPSAVSGKWNHLGDCGNVLGLGIVWALSHPHESGTCTWRPYVCSLPAAWLVPSEIPIL